MKYRGYAGTYTSGRSEGIYAFEMEDGILSDAGLLAKVSNPKYLCVQDGFIYALTDMENGSGVTVLDRHGTILDALAYEKKTSCYITVHQGKIYTANYHEGTWSILAFDNGHLKLEKTITVEYGAGTHEVLFWKDSILVPALLKDILLFYTADGKEDGFMEFEKGTGPRHGVITKDGSLLYLVSELSNELFCIDLHSRKILKQIPILENGLMHVKDTAAIRMSSDEQYLYISTRTQDVISVVKIPEMKLMQVIPSGGQHPRDIWLQEPYLLVGNRYSDSLLSMHIKDGIIEGISSQISIPEIVSIALEETE